MANITHRPNYDEYRRTGDIAEVMRKAMTHEAVTSADVGAAWLDATNDPRQMARAHEDYERGRRGCGGRSDLDGIRR